MFFSSSSFRRHTALYAALIAASALLTWLVVAVVGNDPYNRKTSLVSWVPTVYFVALALLVYRRRPDTEMPFPYGFALGVATAVLGAALAALLFWLFATVAGPALFAEHVQAMLAMLQDAKPRLLTLQNGATYYQMNYARTQAMTLGDVVLDDFLGRAFVGSIAGLLAAILFRKADPLGQEPERAPRPADV